MLPRVMQKARTIQWRTCLLPKVMQKARTVQWRTCLPPLMMMQRLRHARSECRPNLVTPKSLLQQKYPLHGRRKAVARRCPGLRLTPRHHHDLRAQSQPSQ